METTLARWWIRNHQLHNYLENLPDDASAEERAVINQLSDLFQDQRGTLLAMAESLHSQRPVIKPLAVPKKYVDLRSLDNTSSIYFAILSFAQNQWPHLHLISNNNFVNHGRLFLLNKLAQQLQFIHRNNIQYGCVSSLCSKADQYALLQTNDKQVPVQILRHFQVEVAGEDPVICSLVARLSAQDIPILPWSLYSDNLGYYVTCNDIFDPIEAVSLEQLVAPVVTSPFVMNETGQRLQILIAYDWTGCKVFEDGTEFIKEDVA